jgi:hypothetical protein
VVTVTLRWVLCVVVIRTIFNGIVLMFFSRPFGENTEIANQVVCDLAAIFIGQLARNARLEYPKCAPGTI